MLLGLKRDWETLIRSSNDPTPERPSNPSSFFFFFFFFASFLPSRIESALYAMLLRVFASLCNAKALLYNTVKYTDIIQVYYRFHGVHWPLYICSSTPVLVVTVLRYTVLSLLPFLVCNLKVKFLARVLRIIHNFRDRVLLFVSVLLPSSCIYYIHV